MDHVEELGDRPVGNEPVTPATVGDDPALVLRARLLDRLPPVPPTRLTVLHAPAGYGKTVLASRWAASRAALPVAWVSFRADDDARAMAARLVEGLAPLVPQAPAALRSSLPTVPRSFGRQFLPDVRRHLSVLDGAVLVLDALDTPRAATPVSELERWTMGLPAGIRTVVTCRGWPEAVSSGRGGVRSIGAADLAFTAEEVRAVVERSSGPVLDEGQLELLVARTEGWPFAVRVAATELLGQADPDRVVRRLLGTNRQIEAILSAEVLERVPEVVARFLRRTSVLDVLRPDLCAAVAGEPHAGAILEMLERTGAFTGADAHRPGDRRYHPLLRDLLRSGLRSEGADAERALLRRATDWYARRGEPELAARYAVETEDPDLVLGVVDRFARAAFEQGAPEAMLDLLDAVPGGTRVDVALRRACLLTMAGATRQADQVLKETHVGPADRGARAIGQALRATWVFFDAGARASIAAADDALGLLRELDPDEVPDLLGLTSSSQLQVMASGSRARALWGLGELEDARRGMVAALGRPDLYAPWQVHVLSALAVLEAWSGNLRAALAAARRAVVLAARTGLLQHPATLDAHLAIAHVLLERDDLTRSVRILDAIEGRLRRFRRPTSVAMWTVELASHRLASGRLPEGLAAIRGVRTSGEPPPPPVVSQRVRATEARLLLQQRELVGAEAAAARGGVPVDPSFAAVTVHLAVARGDLDAATRHLATWRVRPSDLQGALSLGLWTSIVAAARGEVEVAVRLLYDRVVPLAAAQGHRRLFLDAGEPCERTLRAVSRVAPSRPVEGLLAAFEASRALAGGAVAGLSERELEILRFLPTDLSAAEIAAHLYISLNTLKTHLRTIYRKLGVGDRRDAVRRAASLGLA